mgnify:CR=1 FL=1
MFEKMFKLKEKGTSVKTELIAGLTTFLAMAYILAVNPGMLGITGMSVQSVFLATAISAGISSIIMGVLANYPVALAPGMGVNALFAFTLCGSMGYSWQAALAAVFLSGIIFILISVTGVRKMIINAIPAQLKLAIGAGIGFFIAFIGLKNAGIIVANESTFVALGKLSEPTVLLAVFGLVITLFLLAKKVSAAVFVGLVITAVVGVICGLMGIEGMPMLPQQVFSFDFEMPTLGAFASGFGELFSNPNTFIALFSLLFVDFFDTAGTLLGVANRANLVDENGELERIEPALLSDAIGTTIGAILGTSTVTSFVESTSGVESGGRTGLTACTTGILFLLSVFFYPLLSTITNAVTAPALIVVGILMAQQLGGIDWNDFVFAAAGFTTVIMMILCYSISNGIALGFITYAVAMVGTNRTKEIKPIVWVLVAIFIVYFATAL